MDLPLQKPEQSFADRQRFSVIIPTFNRLRFLEACITSVKVQTLQPHEIIVIDDGSTDGTDEWLKSQHPDVHVILQKNGGPGAARNRGASIASGDYLSFLDSDDLWFPWTLATFASLIERHGSPSLLFGRFLDFTDECELTNIVFEEPIGVIYPDFLSSHSEGHFCGAGMMVVRRDVFRQTSGFEEDRLNAEDHDLALTLGNQTGFVQIRKPVTVSHRCHLGSEMTDLGKTLKGLERLVSKEKAARYPGGSERRHARRNIIANHVRSAVIGATNAGKVIDAAPLYFGTFGWNLRLGRAAYLAAVPVLAARRKLMLI